MERERKSGAIPPDPEYPYRMTDIIRVTGMSRTKSTWVQLSGEIDRTALTPFTDPRTNRVWLSVEDFLRIVTAINEKNENGSLRSDSESAILPDGSQITARRVFHIRQITEIVTKAREEQRPFSLQQIMNVLDPTPKRSKVSKANARQKALDTIKSYRTRIEPNGWVIDSITPMEDKEGRKNPQFWFRRQDEPRFTPFPNTEALT